VTERCEACEQKNEEIEFLRQSIKGVPAMRADLEELIKAVECSAELYAKPTAYRTSKGAWSMNTSIGFETRYEELVSKAEALLARLRSKSSAGNQPPAEVGPPRSRPGEGRPDDPVARLREGKGGKG
jgi:hypothetical protein